MRIAEPIDYYAEILSFHERASLGRIALVYGGQDPLL